MPNIFFTLFASQITTYVSDRHCVYSSWNYTISI